MMTHWTIEVSLVPPSLEDNTADADRLIAALRAVTGVAAVSVDHRQLVRLPQALRRSKFRLRCVLCPDAAGMTVIGIDDASAAGPAAGVAVDLGTSRVVVRIVDLISGRILSESAFENPQTAVAPDVLARIHHADTEGGLNTLQGLIVDGLNRQIAAACKQCGIPTDALFLAAVAGNTTMTHLLLGLDPHWIIREPYIPVVNRPGMIPAVDLGLHLAPSARVFTFPNIGSYFGGDLIAGILYSGMHRREETALLVDVGTNAEVVLGNGNWLIACAGAAGPALEGGVTRMGMMAGPGVIDRVHIDPDTREIICHTIEDAPPVGICGSGLIDLAAHLFRNGMLDIRGKFVPDRCGSRLLASDGLPELVVVDAARTAAGDALTISQADMDSLVRSKAAMYTILETIHTSVGMDMQDLPLFYVAGTFGSFIDPASAITIGMLPDLPPEAFEVLGNSSLEGATRLLADPRVFIEIDEIRDRITYMELNVNQDFMNRFSAARFLPHTDAARFPSVPLPRL